MYRLLFVHQFMNDPKWYSGKILSILDETDPEFWHDFYSFVKHSDRFSDQEKSIIFYGMAQNPFVPQSLFATLFDYEPTVLMRHKDFWQWGYQFFLNDDESSKKVRSVIEQHAWDAISHDEIPLDVFERLFPLIDKREKENLTKKFYRDPEKLEIIFKNLSFDDDKMFLRIINFLSSKENLPDFVFNKLSVFAAWKLKKLKEEESIKYYFNDLIDVLWQMVRKKEAPREFVKKIGVFAGKVEALYQSSEEYKDISFDSESSLKKYCETVLLSKKEILSKWDKLNLRWVLDAYAFDSDLFHKLLHLDKHDSVIPSYWDLSDRFDFVSKNEEDVKRFIDLTFGYGNAFFLLDKMSRWPDHLAEMGLRGYFDRRKGNQYWEPNKEEILLLSKISPKVLEKFQEDFYVLFKKNHELNRNYYLNHLSDFMGRFTELDEMPKESKRFWKSLFEKLLDEELLDFFIDEFKGNKNFKMNVFSGSVYGFLKFFSFFNDEPIKRSVVEKITDFSLEHADDLVESKQDYFFSYLVKENLPLNKGILLYDVLYKKGEDQRFVLLENPYIGETMKKVFSNDITFKGSLVDAIKTLSAPEKSLSMAQ